MVEVYSIVGENEPDTAKRTASFNKGVNTLNKLKNHFTKEKDDAGRAKIELATGYLMIRRMNGEIKMNLLDLAQETRGKAASVFLALMAIPENNEKLQKIAFYIQEAYKEGIPLLIEHGTPDIALDQCEKYLATFPEGKYAPQVRAWLNQSKSQTN
jgi:hypothetical protein